MGIYNGSVAYRRFKLIHNNKRLTTALLSDLLEPYKAPPLKLEASAKSEKIGWVRPLTPQDADILGEDAPWDASDCQVTGGTMLRARYERRKISNGILQMIYKQKLVEHLQAHGKNMPKLERQKLKEDIAADLIRRTLPQIQFIDILWRDQHQELLVFTNSKTLSEKVLQLFQNTFEDDLELRVINMNTTTVWIDDDDSEVRLNRIITTEPTVFAKTVN